MRRRKGGTVISVTGNTSWYQISIFPSHLIGYHRGFNTKYNLTNHNKNVHEKNVSINQTEHMFVLTNHI